MGTIDVLIPAVAGLACVLFPDLMARNASPAKLSRIRKIGFVLLGVAALYLMIKLSGH